MEIKKEIFNDVWFFYKKYVMEEIVDSDTYWEAVQNSATEIIKKHGRDPFARSLIGDVIMELERQKQQYRYE